MASLFEPSAVNETMRTEILPWSSTLPGDGLPQPTSALSGLSPAALLRLQRFEDLAQAANTTRAYATQVRAFAAWAAVEGLDPMPPVSPLVAAAWLTALAEGGARASTVAVALAALKSTHRIAGFHFADNDPAFRRVLTGIRRSLVATQRQAAPLRADLLADILRALPQTDIGIRNGALLAMLYAFALRRAELAGLDFQEVGTGTGVLRLTPTGLEVVLHRSKSCPGHVVQLSVSIADNPLCHVAIRRWIDHAGLGAGAPFMRHIKGQGGIGGRISEDGILRAVRGAVARFHRNRGLSAGEATALAAQFSGHSGRMGLVVSAKEAGVSDSDIARTTRHVSASMIARYSQQVDRAKTAPHRVAGVGV